MKNTDRIWKWIDKIWSVSVRFNEFWMTNLRKYEHILYENSDFMSQDWEKINQKFAWLKVASINISRITVSDCAPFLVVPFLFDIERN